MDLTTFPGGELVARGLADLHNQIPSEEALLVLVAGPRLRDLGFYVPEPTDIAEPYNHRLYEAIEARCDRGAHAAYNALIQRIVSFAQTYSQAQRAGRASGGEGQI